MTKKALITGITGQDGSYLAELLLEKGYEVYGLIRRHSTSGNLWRIEHILDDINLVYGDITDQSSLYEALKQSDPDEVYHLAAMSFVGESWRQPSFTYEVNAVGTLKLLESIRQYNPSIRVYNASSSEMYGRVQEVPQTEKTPFYPLSPYAVSKVAAFYTCLSYRMSYDMFICSGISFNHGSPRRGLEFVTRKITHGVAEIVKGKQKYIELGNIKSKRDWGHAKDYVRAFWLMLQQKEPDDYVIASGKQHSIEDVLDIAFGHVGIDWRKGNYVRISDKYFRPADVTTLLGDATKAREKLGWVPEYTFEDLIKEMVENDLKR